MTLLQGRNFAHLATVNVDGSPEISCVWVDVDRGVILINTPDRSRKVANMRRDSRVALSIHAESNPYESVSIMGQVEEITDQGALEHRNALAKKYLDRDNYPLPDDQTNVIVRIRPVFRSKNRSGKRTHST